MNNFNFNIKKISIAVGVAVVVVTAIVSMFGSVLEKRLEFALPTLGEWQVSGAFPLIDAFHVGTIKTVDTPLVEIRHALFYGWPFQYCCGWVKNARLDTVNIVLGGDIAFPSNERKDETLFLYKTLSVERLEFPTVTVTIQTPFGKFDAIGAGVITTDALDNNSKSIKMNFTVNEAGGEASGTIRGRLTNDGSLNGQIVLESATIKNAIGFSGKRIGGILDFEKKVGSDWILSGEGSAGFMNVLGKNLSGVEILYLDDKTAGKTKTILLNANEMETGVRTNVELTFDKDGQLKMNTDQSIPKKSKKK